MPTPEYVVDYSLDPPLCLPTVVALCMDYMQDITVMGDEFRVYIDVSSGIIHDGKTYYELAQLANT